jgi:type IV secretion system protein VirD4
MISLAASFALVILLLSVKLWLKKKNGKNILGGAHFSSVFEAKNSGLFAEEGIVLGKAFGKILKLPGFESVLVTAPTGAGKTTSIAIPNLIEWKGSGIFNDLKGELFEKTAQYRQEKLGNDCYRFAPTDAELNTHRYNPFFYVSENPNLRIRDLQLIAETLIPADRTDGGFWCNSSREMFLMLSLYLLETKGTPTLAEMSDLSRKSNFIGWLREIIKEKVVENTVFEQCANSLLSADPEKTQKNILKDFHSRMNLLVDPLIRHATSGNDFDLRELRRKKMSIYIQIQDSDKQRLKPILTLFWAQFIHLMTEHEPDLKKEPYPVLALLDEFGNMASIDKLKEGMSFFRSYRIRAIVIVQYLSQIVAAYGQHDSRGFFNAKVKIAFALNDIQDARFFSECLGRKTIEIESHSSSHGVHQSTSKNKSLQSHPLMTSDEIMSMESDSTIILLEARPPIKAKKCPWFKGSYYRTLIGDKEIKKANHKSESSNQDGV